MGSFGGSKSLNLGAGRLYLIGDKTVAVCVLFLDFFPLLGMSGVLLRALSPPFASRFFRDSFFSRCSRGAGFLARPAAESGFSGEETAGTCCSSSKFKGRFWGTEDGGGLAAVGEPSAMVILESMSSSCQKNLRRPLHFFAFTGQGS